MPAPLPTPTGVAKFTFKQSTDSGTFGWSFMMKYTGGPPSTADLTTLATEVQAAWAGHLASLFCASWVLTSTIAGDLANPGTVLGATSTSTAGTRPGSAVIDQGAACLVFRPNHKYRGARPKCFMPAGADTDLLNGSQWDTAFVTEVETKWAAFIAACTGQVAGTTTLAQQQSVSYIEPPYTNVPVGGSGRVRREGTLRNPPAVYDVLSVFLQQKLGSQRRRRGSV